MAQLKNSVVNGDLVVTDSTLTDSLQVTTVIAPTSSGSYNYGTGENGQALRSNGTTTYWGNLPTYQGMTESEIDDGTGISNRTISPKNLKYAVREYETANYDNMRQLYYNGYTTMNILDCYGISSATQKTSFILEFNNEVLEGTYEFAAYIVTLSSVTNCTVTFYNSDNSSVGTCQLTTNSASAHATVSLSDIAVKMTLSFSSSTTINIDSFGLFPKFLWDYAYKYGIVINMVQPSLPTPLITQKLNKLKSDYEDVKINVTNLQSQQSKDTAALTNLINTGSKNLMPTPDGQSVPPTRWINISIVLQPGTYRVFFGNLQSNDTDDTRCQACFLSGSTQVSNWLTIDRGTNVYSGVCTITAETTTFRLYPSTSYALSEGDTVTFSYCMICKECDWQISQEYVPYCSTPPEIHADVTNLQSQQTKDEAALINLINSGAKNRLKINASNRTHNGITFTVNSDGTVTANGTATANAYIQVASISADSELFDGSYRLCGCPEGGSRQSYAQYAALSNYARYDYGKSVSLIPTGLTGNVGIIIMIYSGYTANNVVFKPMVCKEADYLVSPEYAQYCPTLPELYALIKSYHP